MHGVRSRGPPVCPRNFTAAKSAAFVYGPLCCRVWKLCFRGSPKRCTRSVSVEVDRVSDPSGAAAKQRLRGTAWASFQAWSEFADHHRAFRDASATILAVLVSTSPSGWALDPVRGRAKEAESAPRGRLHRAFRDLRRDGPTPVSHSDNGLIFQSRRFRAACRSYRLMHEFITPYTLAHG